MSAGTSVPRLDGPGPADLLWRQRFLNQHAHLLGRMNALEEKDAVHHARTKKAEQAAAVCNATTKEIERLKARLSAFEEDDDQQKQNEMVSKMLHQQTRDTVVLKDQVAKFDGLGMRYRNQEEDIGELRQKLQECIIFIKILEDQVKTLQTTMTANIESYTNANRNTTARPEHVNTRNELRDRQLKHMEARPNALETQARRNTARNKDSLGTLKEIDVPNSAGNLAKPVAVRKRPGVDLYGVLGPWRTRTTADIRASPPRRPGSPKSPESALPLLTQSKTVVKHGPITSKKTVAGHGRFTPSQQNAQIPTILPETQPSTQETTSVEDSQDDDLIMIYEGDTHPLPDMQRSAYSPRKKPRLSNDTSHMRSQEGSRIGVPTTTTQSPRKVVVLPVSYAEQRPGVDAPTQTIVPPQPPAKRPRPAVSAKKHPKDHATKASAPKQAPGVRAKNTSTQASQSQTVQHLRRSARNLGPSATTDTQHVELGTNSKARAVPSPRKTLHWFSAASNSPEAALNRSRGAFTRTEKESSPSRTAGSPSKAPSSSVRMAAGLLKAPNTASRSPKKRKHTNLLS